MKKNNIPLVLGMFIPLLMIIFVAVSIYVPALLTQPKYNFIYATGGDYYQLESYAVKNAKLVKNEIKYPPNYNTAYTPIPQKESKLYIHDVERNISREIFFEEAQKFNLNPASISPDGFEVVSGSHDYSIFSLFFPGGISTEQNISVGTA